MNDLLVRLFGWRALTFQGDPLVGDRWRWLRRHLTGGSIRTLDAGCGNGAFSFAAGQRGNTVIGLTFSDDEVRKCARRARLLGLSHVEFRLQDLRKLEDAHDLGTFDQVVALEVIEHILDDAKLVRNLAARLKPGGRLLLSTPHKHYRHLYREYLSPTEDGGHVRWGYTHDELRSLFEVAGLVVEREDFLCGIVSQKLTNMMRIFDRIHPRLAWAVVLPLRPLIAIDSMLTRATGYPWMTVAIVGRKPSDGRAPVAAASEGQPQ